jgi:hypothetical protein
MCGWTSKILAVIKDKGFYLNLLFRQNRTKNKEMRVKYQKASHL